MYENSYSFKDQGYEFSEIISDNKLGGPSAIISYIESRRNYLINKLSFSDVDPEERAFFDEYLEALDKSIELVEDLKIL